MEAKTTKRWSKEDLEYFKNLILKKREETLKPSNGWKPLPLATILAMTIRNGFCLCLSYG